MASTELTERAYLSFIEGDIEYFYTYVYADMILYASSCLPGQLSIMAEDCVQNAVEKAYGRRSDFTSAAQWKAFLITCIRNKAISYLRNSNASERYQEFVIGLGELHEDILLDYIRQETLQRLYAAIDGLPQEMRDLLEMSFEEGLKNSEIAERLGVAEITVKKRKARLIAMLRSAFPDGTPTAMVVLILGMLAIHHTPIP
ncbi:MAG: sigma-70 family RNA polymerase sigma factor [Muribaculaceae bacterium]|nr:sigma-70 family RNA polymerase sigma factor [Muribaculaceae bacterium]